jgi:hypothetical protein
MNVYKRNGFKWSINEVLTLQREYELLELTIQEIAIKHQRKVDAIIYKLLSEGFIKKEQYARGYNESFQEKDYDLEHQDTIQMNYSEDSYFKEPSEINKLTDN